MNRLFPAHVLATALCLPGPGIAQSATSIVIVVRHDPSLVQLHPQMLTSLLSPGLLDTALDKVDRVADNSTPEITAEFQILDRDAPTQPPGVLVTRLYAFSEELGPAQLEQYARAVIDEVAGALHERLDAVPRQRLARELSEIEVRIEAVAESTARQAATDAFRSRLRDATVQVDALEVERATERNVLQSLEAQLAAAQRDADHSRERAQQVGIELAVVRRRLQELAQVVRESPELIEEVGRLQDQVATRQVDKQDMDARVVAIAERVAQLAVALNEARVRVTRLDAEKDGLMQSLAAMRAKDESEPAAAGGFAERELASLHRRRERLVERLAELRSVEVEVWR